MREFDEDVVEEGDGCVIFLVVVFVGCDKVESVFKGVELLECGFVKCVRVSVGGAWGECCISEEAEAIVVDVDGC